MRSQAPNSKHQIPNKTQNPNPKSQIKSSNPPILQSSNLPILLLLSLSLFLLTSSLFAQNEANVWYFPWECGLDFNSGEPVVLYDEFTNGGWGNATISDSLGNFLFYYPGYYAYNKYGILTNSDGMAIGGRSGAAIVKWPGKDRIYYVFSATSDENPDRGFYYSIIDMKLMDGRGYVTEKNIMVSSGYDVDGRVATVKKTGAANIWVITRKFTEDAMAAYLVDEDGFHPDPVLSVMPDRECEDSFNNGNTKISPDKKFLISSYGLYHDGFGELEVCNFNADNGTVEYFLTYRRLLDRGYSITGIEFSPDSKYLYVSIPMPNSVNCEIYQYEMQYITDSAMFKNSGQIIGIGPIVELQLARDGKIYCADYGAENLERYFLDVIHKPWIRGIGCMYENNAINQYPHHLYGYLPNILVDYLLRFEWTGEQCQRYPINFKPNFIPTPDSIVWNFGEFAPGSISHELSPTYSFKTAGIHEVKVDVWYPGGRFEHTSREIEIQPSPQPDLGNDTSICQGESLTITANGSGDYFAWSTGQFGTDEITVTDTGYYWVRAGFFSNGCYGYDTIHIAYHPLTTIDETNLQITPTTCNGSSGSITGLTALGSTPFAFQWLDLSGIDYGTNIDATNLPAGQYQLTITDGNGCETVSEVYTIEDAGDLQVTQVQTTRPHCFRDDGQIVVHAFSPSGSILEYSIDAGVNYQYDSVFSGLFAMSYAVQVRDTNGCSGFYLDNPVLLEDIPGPQVTQVNVTDETDFLGNGAIEILASGSTPVIYYSIDSGATWQLNNGNFWNLESGIWNLVIKDENGCDTAFTVEIQNIILTFLHAVTGEGGHCLGNTALVPVNVDNFNSVADFHLKLGYNAGNLECEGFANVNVQLLDSLTGWVDPMAGDIHLAWKSPTSVTFAGTEKVADLVFTTKNPGQGELAWYTGETESYFTNSGGNPIPAQFSTGEVTVYEPPEIILDQSKTVCTGQFVGMMSVAIGNQPPIYYQWIYPNGDTTGNDPFFFSVTQADAGLYTLLATDHVGCTDQKSIELIVSDNPIAAFHDSDTLEMQAGDVLDAGAGLSSYHWNTGDSTESIEIYSEGMYSVEMKSSIGCVGSDSVYVKLIEDEIPPPDPSFNVYIPNAFSPDGDGVNDVFRVVAEGSRIYNLQTRIYDRWGGQVFESSGLENGWDGKKAGKDCPGGVYVYKIVYSVDGVPGSQEKAGTVMLVR